MGPGIGGGRSRCPACVRHFTDSDDLVAFHEPGLMDGKV